jgi:hypothetical protein
MTKARVNDWFERRIPNMRIAIGSWMKWSFLGMALVSAATFCSPVHSQSAPSVRVGGVYITDVPEDWSHHYAVFSDPGTEEDALQSGRYAQWQNVVNNPRYVIQQLKRNARVQGPASLDADYRYRWIQEEAGAPFWATYKIRRTWGLPEIKSEIKKDWSQSLGGTGLADGHYPAKYPFATTTASCSDYVVYPTGAAGSTTQATIMAFTNLYAGGSCGSTNPTVYWAYNTGTGAKANLSPTLSLDGTQVTFIQVSTGGVASLVILKMAGSGGTYKTPTFGTGSGSVTAAAYRACTAPCFTAIALNGNPNDAASAPFYNYDTDVLYVGDSSGKVHLFTGVFNGTPGETTTGGWPVTASTNTPATLTSPIYDSGGSNRIFVTDQAGYLHTFAVTSPPGSVSTSGRLENNTSNVFEPPIVDGTTEEVYTFIGYSGDTGNDNPSYINVFPAAALGTVGTGAGTGYGTGVNFPNGGNTNPTTSHMRAGAFDYQYLIGTGTTGNIYTCENGTVYQIPLATITTPTVNTYNKAVTTVGTAATCAPVTEFQSVSTATTISNNGVTSATQTTIPVASVTGMSTTAPNNYLLVGSEIMKITAVGAVSVTVTRGSLGTTAGSSYPPGTAVQVIQDWMFTSVEANSTQGSCATTSGCLLNYDVLGAAATGTPTTGFPAAGGTSGIVIDNQVPAATQVGAEQIYYNLLTGTTNNAIQASQSNP